ncbi:unnamed protein product [Phyllotreta striolata]|uniref:Uncharacterized protein n=1 Tax=Phyllotreta striolata TaxID=444603 RepID=A0A9N9TKQ3_PHYSR|nr:unnamed protein product [Phyllotreta striolata]
MEHFKKRLIHKHQKPARKVSPKPVLDNGEEDVSSNSSTGSGVNSASLSRAESRKEANQSLKVARKRAVCRSKFRHNSLKIFKLGSSIPTSLCKSKEPYNVSAEKKIQHCYEESRGKAGFRRDEKSANKETITEQIINSMEGSLKKDQRIPAFESAHSGIVTTKHNLPPVISDIPAKRSRCSGFEDEQKTDLASISETENQRKFESTSNSILSEADNKRTNEEPIQQRNKTPEQKQERISPDSTFNENTSNQYPIDFAVTKPALSLPISKMLPKDTSAIPIPASHPSVGAQNLCLRPVSNPSLSTEEKHPDKPINLSIKKPNETPQKSEPITAPSARSNCQFPEIQHQIRRKSKQFNPVEDIAATSNILMFSEFSVEILVVLSKAYREITKFTKSTAVRDEFTTNLRKRADEILEYVNLKLFDLHYPYCRSYTQELMECDLELHIPFLKHVLGLFSTYYSNHVWMKHVLMTLSNKISTGANYLAAYPPAAEAGGFRPSDKIKKPVQQSKVLTYSDFVHKSLAQSFSSECYPGDNRHVPPKLQKSPPTPAEIFSLNKPLKKEKCVDKETEAPHKKQIYLNNNTVIIKDHSMEITKATDIKVDKGFGKVEMAIEKQNKDQITVHQKRESQKEILKDDLHLFKELLKQEDQTIYNRIINKIKHVKGAIYSHRTQTNEDSKRNHRKSFTKSQSAADDLSSRSLKIAAPAADVIVIDDDVEDSKDLNQNYFPTKKILTLQSKKEDALVISKKYPTRDYPQETEDYTRLSLIQKPQITCKLPPNPPENINKNDLKKPAIYSKTPKYPIFESPDIFPIPSNSARPFLTSQTSTSSRTSDVVSPTILQFPMELSPLNPYSHPGTNLNWKEYKNNFLDSRQLMHRRQSVETISSVGSDYSPNLDADDNNFKIRIDSKWYRVKRSVMDCIPKGKLCYVREKNYLIRYYDDNQLSQFIQNMNVNLISPGVFDFLKLIRERVDGFMGDDIFISPCDLPENSHLFPLPININFTKDDYISIPEMYVEEVEKVEKYAPKDFLGFYKYVTGYQIVNNHHPISFQTFLTMHNTNGIKIFFKRYLLSILENKCD